MLKYIVVLALVAANASAFLRQCPDGSPLPVLTDLSGCLPTDPVCIYPNGATVDVHLQVTQTVDSNTLAVHLTANIGGSDVEYPLPTNDACTLLTNAVCPVTAGALLDFVTQIQAVQVVAGPVVATAVLTADNGVIVACGEFDIEVTA